MAKVRSPNFPNLDLGAALSIARKAFDKDHRNKMSRDALSKHLGHESLSGSALMKIGALRAYGLVEGSGEELRISDDAVTAMMAPQASPERSHALHRLFLKPALFQEIAKNFPTIVSVDNLRYWLVKRDFTAEAAAKAAKAYLESYRLVKGEITAYNPALTEEEENDQNNENEDFDPPPPPPPNPGKVKIMQGERELTTGLLSKDASFRLIVTGQVGEKEIERLIKKLELDKEILAEVTADADKKAAN
jgi:hypothetical protein